MDGRTLGLARIGIALMLIADVLRRIPWIRDLYSNAGLIPNHTVLWRPPFPRIFSLMFMSSLPEEAAIWLALSFFCFFCFLVGWKTRLFHVLSFVMATSLHNRILQAENWGAVAIAVLLLWTMFLPMGRRFSVDAVLASLRARRDETPEDLAAGVPPPDRRPAYSFAVACLLMQIAVIYWFNYVHKSGSTWKDGTAVYYVLRQERIITMLGLWVRENLPFSVTKLLTHGTLVVEAAVPFMILTPVFWRWTRPIAAALLFGLHFSIALLVNLGIFSAAMIAFEPLLITQAQWRLGAALVPKRGRARTVFYDADCGVCFLLARVLARMDTLGRLRFLPNRDTAALPAGIDPALLQQAILVVDPERDRRWTRAQACVEIAAALPLGRFWVWPLRLPGVRALADAFYGLVARNRTRISAWLGLPACGLPGTRPQLPAPKPPTPLGEWLRAKVGVLREVAVALTFVIIAAEVSVANPAVPRILRFDKRPEWMVAAVMYPHIFEGWSLFAPQAPLSDEMVVVDAVTRDGRRVDPYNEVGSRIAKLPVDDAIPERLGHDSFFCDYTLRIPDASVFHQAFLEWILRYPERTGNPGDAIVKFEAYSIWQDSPPPGATKPTNIRKRLFLHYP
jgi:predicted DCC family thiol-disulfide oxidoreductase YuxK